MEGVLPTRNPSFFILPMIKRMEESSSAKQVLKSPQTMPALVSLSMLGL